VTSEFADVVVEVDASANDTRLRLEDAKTGRVRYLDALELESLVWGSPEALASLLDPSRGRWRDRPVHSVDHSDPPADDEVVGLVTTAYSALATGDRARLVELLAEDFVGVLADGLPVPIGGRHVGSEAMIDDGWWAIGRQFKVRAEPEAWYRCGSGRLVVTGRYRGHHRHSDLAIDAAFAHIWTSANGRLVALQQITDTVAWGLDRSDREETA
jgi:ketosteroid isomerase-like protein